MAAASGVVESLRAWEPVFWQDASAMNAPEEGTEPERPQTSGRVVKLSVVEHELSLADTPTKVKSLDDKLAVIQELFRKERRALGDQNKLAELRIRAQRRGGELLAATVRPGRPSKRSHDATISLPEGIDKHMSSRWQAVASIAERALDAYLKMQEERGEEVTTSGFVRFAEAKPKSEERERTPSESKGATAVVERVLSVLGEVDLDPCHDPKLKAKVKAKRVYKRGEDGLEKEWQGKVYVSPPHGQELSAWVEKLASEFEAGNVKEAVALVPVESNSEWFVRVRAYPRCFLSGKEEGAAPYAQMALYFGSDVAAFARAFADVGDTYALMSP